MNIPLGILKHFYEVARHRSFTGAASALRISQPGVSKAISQLEYLIGNQLVLRNKSGVSLTPTGEVLFHRCKIIFAEVAALDQDLKSLNERCEGPLKIGASDNLCNHVLPVLLKDFCRSYPLVTPRILSGTADAIQKELLGEKIEIGFFYTSISDRRLSEKVVCFVENVLIYPNGESFEGKKKSLVKSLKYIGSRQDDYSSPYPALKLLRQLGIEPRVGFETNNQETQKKMVMAGLGYSIMPLFMVKDELKAGLLRVFQSEKKIGNELRMVSRKNSVVTKQAKVFSEFFTESVQRYL